MSDSQSRPHPRLEARDLMYENPYQQVYKIRLNFKSSIKEIFVTDFGARVGVVAEGPEGILLTRQYRHLIDRVSWEIPGGKVERGEDLVEAARRECLEETGILCHELKHLLMFHPGLDTLYNPTHLFHTRAFVEKALAVPVHQDEVCGREWVPLEKCIAMISSQTMVDSLSVIALLSYNAFVKQK
jgi:8-oxo-dGTP pyrophosphatase MutT (NUDIX family)